MSITPMIKITVALQHKATINQISMPPSVTCTLETGKFSIIKNTIIYREIQILV